MTPTISILVSARRNSKYLAKFLFGFYANTIERRNIDLHVMLNEHDWWNRELVSFFDNLSDSSNQITFYRENMRLGRAGLHEYFNQMVPNAKGGWLIYFCEDHFISLGGWDRYVMSEIERLELNAADVWCLMPKFDNVGAMNQIVSRGFIEAMGGRLGRHGWIDSYINDVCEAIPDRVVRLDIETFHDFTHDKPSPMADSEIQSLNTDKGRALPAYKSDTNDRHIAEDREKLKRAIERGVK